MRDLRVWWLGRVDFEEAYALQQYLLEGVFSGRDPDTILLLEHEPVITCGRGSDLANLGPAAARLPVFYVERGGDVTWHGPGQLVGYPIIALTGAERDLHAYLRRLEEVLIRTCAGLGCSAGRRPGYTGVWTPAQAPARKLASIGVAVRRWVTWHGFALNVETDPAAFAPINPCGLAAGLMTSLAAECPRPPGLKRTIEALARHLPDVFDRRLRFERATTRPFWPPGAVPDSVVYLLRTD